MRANLFRSSGRLFLARYMPNEVGLHCMVDVREVPVDGERLGEAIQSRFATAAPAVLDSNRVYRHMIGMSGAKSQRAFFRDAAMATVEKKGGWFEVTASRRDGNGFVGDSRARVRQVGGATSPKTLGRELLAALEESAALSAG